MIGNMSSLTALNASLWEIFRHSSGNSEKKEKLRSIVKGMCRKLYSTKYVQLVKH